MSDSALWTHRICHQRHIMSMVSYRKMHSAGRIFIFWQLKSPNKGNSFADIPNDNFLWNHVSLILWFCPILEWIQCSLNYIHVSLTCVFSLCVSSSQRGCRTADETVHHLGISCTWWWFEQWPWSWPPDLFSTATLSSWRSLSVHCESDMPVSMCGMQFRQCWGWSV